MSEISCTSKGCDNDTLHHKSKKKNKRWNKRKQTKQEVKNDDSVLVTRDEQDKDQLNTT